MTYQVRLSQFEGPLDLLLHLIRRDKIDIYDIPISHITAEYLAYIDIMQELELEVAGDFFVMAATLMRIKAQMLLPRRTEIEGEEEDPRDELVRNLLEYKKFKEAALHFSEMEEDRRRVYTRPTVSTASSGESEQTIEVTVFDLFGAFQKVLEELKKQVNYRIEREPVSLEDRIQTIRERLLERKEVLFTELFESGFDKMEIIVTFLAILELVRLGELVARQMSGGPDIWLYEPASAPRPVMEKGMHEYEEQS
jgi:segregation and condensation protein A